MLVACCSVLCVVCCSLFMDCCLVFGVCCFGGWCLSAVVCCVLFSVWCLVFAALYLVRKCFGGWCLLVLGFWCSVVGLVFGVVVHCASLCVLWSLVVGRRSLVVWSLVVGKVFFGV